MVDSWDVKVRDAAASALASTLQVHLTAELDHPRLLIV